jgi:hypothetical protein
MLGIGLVVSEDLKKYAIASVGHVVKTDQNKIMYFYRGSSIHHSCKRWFQLAK